MSNKKDLESIISGINTISLEQKSKEYTYISSDDSDSLSDYDSDEEEAMDDPDYKLLPKLLVKIKIFLKKQNISFCKKNSDGRVNSTIDEETIINILKKSKYSNYITFPNIRDWYDICIQDEEYGKIPINIKSTNMKNADNVSNLSSVVQAYTTYNLDLTKKYNNGYLSKILFEYIKDGKINTNYKKDYFFIVCNKEQKGNVYINSILGLNKITRNINNLPFQVKWKNNKQYQQIPISEQVEKFIKTIKDGNLPWRVKFFLNIDKL